MLVFEKKLFEACAMFEVVSLSPSSDPLLNQLLARPASQGGPDIRERVVDREDNDHKLAINTAYNGPQNCHQKPLCPTTLRHHPEAA